MTFTTLGLLISVCSPTYTKCISKKHKCRCKTQPYQLDQYFQHWKWKTEENYMLAIVYV